MAVWYVGSFWKLIFRWRGSVWRVVWRDVVVFYVCYYSVNLVYRFALDEAQQIVFNNIVIEFSGYLEMIPITLVLGFYVSAVVNRYWNQFESLAWPDDLCCWVNFVIPGNDMKSRMTRRTIARYLVLTCVLAWRDVSTRVRKRFPRIDHIVASGLLLQNERVIYEKACNDSLHWNIPIDWCQRIIEELMHDTGELAAPNASHIMNQLNVYRAKFRLLYSYNWLSVPLTYTQVASIATYSYFALCVVGRQSLDPRYGHEGFEMDFYVPIFTSLQLIFYLGWLKVGQYIMHPFGEDDDDFELNALLDRHLKVAMGLVDGENRVRPPIVEDPFLHTKHPRLPHTVASSKITEYVPKVKTGRRTRHEELILVFPNETQGILDTSPIKSIPINNFNSHNIGDYFMQPNNNCIINSHRSININCNDHAGKQPILKSVCPGFLDRPIAHEKPRNALNRSVRQLVRQGTRSNISVVRSTAETLDRKWGIGRPSEDLDADDDSSSSGRTLAI